MISRRNVKVLLATLLVVSATLPQYSCTRYLRPNGSEVSMSDSTWRNDSSHIRRVVTYHYAFEDVKLSEPSTWAMPIAFCWPILAVLFVGWKPRWRAATFIRWLEPIGVGASAYVIATNNWGRSESGFYLAMSALTLLLLLWVWDVVDRFRTWRHARQAPATR